MPLTAYFQAAINKFTKSLSLQSPANVAAPTHLIVIRKQQYLRGFEKRLALDGIRRRAVCDSDASRVGPDREIQGIETALRDT